jgi:propionate CoA-transferase
VLTKRAAFQVESDGLTLIEVAKGIDVREDVLGQMEFRPKRIADPLPYMEETLFAD